MTPEGATRRGKLEVSVGFLTVVRHDVHGVFGGFLVLNLHGRPLEFHCTTPVKPNRAQEILFGPTLEPYLYGEQLGRALVDKAGAAPRLVCTDVPAMLSLRDHTELPVVWVLAPSSEAQANDPQWRIDGAHSAYCEPASFRLGNNMIATARGFDADRRAVEEHLAAIGERIDLLEPFGRIREAIDEAQRSGR